ncbi:WD repeat protein Lub1 [Entomophthora muscae]|nr:WD repeat protein Lub1 [Entomophthora muscae]
MVRCGAIVEAHQWDSAAQQWQKIGEVVDAVGQGRKQLHDGKEYDYVFDINIDDGAPNLKLPYNVTENPYTAAMNFIQRNELPVSYIDQVAEFITTNTKGETLGVSAPPEQTYVDPYTGGSRYIAQQSTPSKQVASHRFPIREMLTFKQANVDAILTKLTQLNSAVPETLRLDDGQLDALNKLTLSADPTSPGLEPLFKVITSWSASSRFPALDLLRYLTLSVPWYTTRSFASLLESATPGAAMSKDQDIIIMLSCRLISNLIAVSQVTVQKSLKDVIRFIENVGQQIDHLSPNTRIAFFSALVNLSVMFIGKSGAAQDDDCIQSFLTAMSSLVSSLGSTPATPASSSHEAIFRGLVAIGNMFTIHGQDGKDLAEISQLLPALSEIKLKKAEYDAKVSAIAEEISHAFLI